MIEKRLEKATSLLELGLKDTVSTKDFIKAFSNVVDIIKNAKDDWNSVASKKLETLFSNYANAHDDWSQNKYETLAQKISDKLSKVKDGKSPTRDELLSLIKSVLPKPPKVPSSSEIKSLSFEAQRELRDTIQVITDDFKDKIEKLTEEMKKVKQGTLLQGAVPNTRELTKTYDLSASLDGVTKTFNIPGNWKVLLVFSSSVPMIFRENIDYTYTSQTITFTSQITAASTLASGQSVVILYMSA